MSPGLIGLEIVAILALIIANGLLAMAEMAVVSSRKARLQKWSEEGDKKARIALNLANSPDNFLSTIQSGITLIGVCAGALGGATLADELSTHFARVSWLAPWADTAAIIIVVFVISYLSLLFGELVPKRMALNNPERIARLMATPMTGLTGLLFPLVRILSLSTESVMSLIGKHHQSEEAPITEAEIQVLVEEGKAAGVFHASEPELVRRILDLDQVKVSALMTPRRELVWLDKNDPPGALLKRVQASHHNRFPVAEGSVDNVAGLVNARDLFVQWTTRGTIDLPTCLYKPLIMPENLTALEALENFKESKIHAALVMNEYGGLVGLVTITDIVESVLGELPEVGEIARWHFVQREDGSWLFDAVTPIAEFKRLLGIAVEMPEEKSGYYQTLGGFVLHHFQHIPAVAEHFAWDAYRFEIVDMDRHRIDKILVTVTDRNLPEHGDEKPKAA
ncbi:MAG: hemolysin family protein [Candidatus Obscuribacterales bacterium]|nr:hemolysin family protein [Candidatus Obscuribacterales bacterium]